MPTAYAKLLVSVNGGTNQSGGLTLNFGDVVHLSGENPGYWDHGQYEIYDWPPGWTAPGGWTLTSGSDGQKYVFYSVGGATPPDITLPSSGSGQWGKFLFRLVVNDGMRNGKVDDTLTDESTAVRTLSPNLQLTGLAAREQSQFDAQKSWAGQVDENFRKLDLLALGVVAGGITNVPHAGTLVVQDVVVSALDTGTPNKVTKATPSALLAARTVRGVVLAVNGDGTVTIPTPGSILDSTATGLSAPPKTGWVRVNASARCEHADVAAFGDYIVGADDTAGLLHFLPPHEVSSVNEHVVDVRRFGACPGDAATDCTPAVIAALAYAQTNTSGSSTHPNYGVLQFPGGCVNLTQPVRVNQTGVTCRGRGKDLTFIRPNFQGPAFIYGSDNSDVPPVRADGPFGLNAFHFDQGRGYSINLRLSACGEVDLVNALTVEAHAKLTADISGGECVVVAASNGQENTVGNISDSSFLLGYANTFVTNGLFGRVTVGSQVFQIYDAGTTPSGSYHHVAIQWDGSTLYLLKDGNVVASTPTTSPTNIGLLFQQPWEGVWLGTARGLANTILFPVNAKLNLGPTRARKAAIYTISAGHYTAPTGAFAHGDANDLWVINWDNTVQGDVNGGYSQSSRPVWFPTIASDPTVFRALTHTRLSDVTIAADNGAQSGGVLAQQTIGWTMENVITSITWNCVTAYGAFESYYREVGHNGAFYYPGFEIVTTGGDVYLGCSAQNASYGFMINGGATLIGCTVGTWGWRAAGMYLSGGFTDVVSPFFDSESQNYSSRGAIMFVGVGGGVRGGNVTQGLLFDTPLITSDGSDLILDFTSASQAFQSCIVDVLSAGVDGIKLRGFNTNAQTPYVTSSIGADVGKVLYEMATAGDAVGEVRRNYARLTQHQGDAKTTNATPANINDCLVTLDPHSTATIHAEVTARRDNDADFGEWEIVETWQRGRLGTAASLALAKPGSPVSWGNNSGNPPTGWAAALAANGTAGGVNVQVTGASSQTIEWGGNIVVNRARTKATSWTAIELAPSGWFRGDVGSVSSWTDQSGNGNNAAAGSTAPTATTLFGHNAFSFAGAAWFENLTTNLITAGASFTVLAVGKALDATGGCVWCSRTGATGWAAVDVITVSGTTNLGTGDYGGANQNGTLIPANPYGNLVNESQAGFLAEWSSYALDGTTRLMRFDMNRINRFVSGKIGPDSGANGFFIGKNGLGQPWNGLLSEVVVVPRAITMAERNLWQAYVNSYYGI